MIKATVALPVWNSEKILWLALESLCEQKDVNFDWELLIAEEQVNHFGEERVRNYIERLDLVRCVSVRYFAFDYRIPLPQKWKFMAEKRSPSSELYFLQAADCYSEPLRLRRTMDEFIKGGDWIQNRMGYYYSIPDKKLIQFDQKTFGPGCQTGLNMAVACRLLNRLEDSWQDKGIDNWFYRSVKPSNPVWIEDDILGGVDTDGMNNISVQRIKMYTDPKPPFLKTERKLREMIPGKIFERLNYLKTA